MFKRSLVVLILIAAFLLSAWGNVIAAAFCPRYLSNRASCLNHEPAKPTEVVDKTSCHHEMADMEMGDLQMSDTEVASEIGESATNAKPENQPAQVGTESSAEQVTIDFPTEPCGHCWVHSQPASRTATLVAVDPLKQLTKTSAPPADFAALPLAFTVSITPLEHGPPGNVLPRHVLINVFRI